MEFDDAVYNATKNATSIGIVVVAAAGNGGMNLDDTDYNGRFDRTKRDSGAIIVGSARSAAPHEPKCSTCYGTRSDSYAWGENIVTTGYGDKFGLQSWVPKA